MVKSSSLFFSFNILQIKLDENTVLTGSEDGYIRAVSISPNKVLNYVGNHSESDEIEPITRLAMSYDMKFVASLSYDNWIKFHNIANLVDERKTVNLNEEDDSDGEDMQEESDDEENNQPKMPSKVDLKARQKEIKKQKKQEFFSDM